MYQYPDLTGLDGDMLDSGPVGELARAAEGAGWEGFSFTEHPAPGLRWLETGGHQPIQIWIGGNSKLTRRRVAQRANGWMPMFGPEALFTTTRTPSISAGDELAAAIAQLRGDAGERGAALDVSAAHTQLSVHDAGTDWGRHQDAIASLAAAGVTWVIVPGQAGARDTRGA